jgi:hypothetical protein
MEHKKMQELQNKIIGQRNNIGLTKGFAHDTRKRQFIRKGILGIIAGIGIAVFSKTSQAAYSGFINFADETSQSEAAVVPSQSDQAALEAETNEDTYVPPDLIKYSPGVAKAWIRVTYAGGTPTTATSYNVSSIDDDGVGVVGVNLTTAFSGTIPIIWAGAQQSQQPAYNQGAQINSSSDLGTGQSNSSGIGQDSAFCMSYFGDQ